MEKFLKKTGWSNVLSSVVLIIIGILLVSQADVATRIIAYILGAVFIITGILKIIDYFGSKGNYDFFNNDLVFGIIAIILGLVTIFYNGAIEFIIRIMIGAWIIYSAVLRLSLSLKLQKAGASSWVFSLVMAIIMFVLGIYMIATPGAVVSTVGIITIIYSVMDLIESFIFIKNVDDIL